MKNDKFLLGIVVGILVLVVIAVVIVLARGQQEDYTADNSPSGVVHNYFLAVQRQDYEKAYSYLADDLKSKPDMDEFITTVDDFNRRQEGALQIKESSINGDRARVDISIMTYSGGGFFDSGSYTREDTAHLRLDPEGEWKLIEFPYPYWGYQWNEPKPER